MLKSDKIKSIFFELRAAGVDGSAKDVLRLAHFLVQSHNGEIAKSDEFGRVVDSRTMTRLPLDVVMADGGWRVLEYETRRAGSDTAENSFSGEYHSVNKVIVSIWPY